MCPARPSLYPWARSGLFVGILVGDCWRPLTVLPSLLTAEAPAFARDGVMARSWRTSPDADGCKRTRKSASLLLPTTTSSLAGRTRALTDLKDESESERRYQQTGGVGGSSDVSLFAPPAAGAFSTDSSQAYIQRGSALRACSVPTLSPRGCQSLPTAPYCVPDASVVPDRPWTTALRH